MACFVKFPPVKMLVEMKHCSHVLQVKKNPQSVLVHEHLNLSFGKMFCQITTSQNVGGNETLLTFHTSESIHEQFHLSFGTMFCQVTTFQNVG